MEMYYVREYTPTCRFLKIINSTLTRLVDYFKNLQFECILHYIIGHRKRHARHTTLMNNGNISNLTKLSGKYGLFSLVNNVR
jgi:hypothetical protein